ncbi:MAG TPA: MAPEG family protein [Hyphomicrobiales bacterium]|nr:MAPEG family protein [Hyphomicrobiales bacterium]
MAPLTIELQMLAWSVVLGLAEILVAVQAATMVRGVRWNMSSREEPQQPLAGMPGRLDRAYRNFLETFPFFAAAVLICHLAGRHDALTVWGVQLYFWARVAHFLLYAFDVVVVRSVVWLLSVVGIGLLLLALV